MIKEKVVEINKKLSDSGLVILTWGNASAISEEKIFIKPSGVPFSDLESKMVSEVDLRSGRVLGGLKPSVDTNIHIELYKSFDNVGGIIHTHSTYSTVFAQAKLSIPFLGTTHADYFYGDIPVIADLPDYNIRNDYERNIGKAIVKYFDKNKIDPNKMQAALIPSHGTMVWGETIDKAYENAIVLEEIAKLAYMTLNLEDIYGKLSKPSKTLLDKHFFRKHGDSKYYGQQ